MDSHVSHHHTHLCTSTRLDLITRQDGRYGMFLSPVRIISCSYLAIYSYDRFGSVYIPSLQFVASCVLERFGNDWRDTWQVSIGNTRKKTAAAEQPADTVPTKVWGTVKATPIPWRHQPNMLLCLHWRRSWFRVPVLQVTNHPCAEFLGDDCAMAR
jgi:hypothetical protein